MQKFTQFTYKTLASTKFFIASICLFIAHCVWLALSAASLPFDEYYHLGVIKFYSHQWLPFISHQPASMSYVGDMTRSPNYLYHYLMSFPYRFLELFIHNEYWLTVSMRVINVAIVIGGVVLFRKLLLKIGLSRRLTHLSLFVFMMTPMVVYLASEANYDNFMFLLTPIFLGFAVNLYKRKLTAGNIVGFIATACFATLAKNEFLVFAGLVSIYLLVSYIRKRPKKIIKPIKEDFYKKRWLVQALMVFVLLLSTGLFVERYGVNFVRYGQVHVDCQQVQPFEVCKHYSPWWRNYRAKQSPPSEPKHGGLVGFSVHWTSTMARGFVANFANVPSLAKPDDPYGNYEFSPLLAQMSILSYSAMGFLAIAIVFYVRKWWRVGWLRATILIFLAYAFVLWAFNLRIYLNLSQAYAIQPRYLLPLMIPVIASMFYLAGIMFKSKNIRTSLAVVIVLMFVYSAGAFGWFIRSNSGWYWPNNTVISINQDIQKVLRKTIYNTRLPKR